MKLIHDYYKAWETEDKALLNNVLHQEVFGIRLYDESKLFTRDEIFDYFDNTVSPIIEVIETHQQGNIVTCKLKYKLSDTVLNVQCKITLKDNLVYKVYEIIETDKRRIKCTISYDGSGFHGYQKQLNKKTVQGDIEASFSKALKEEVIIHSSGRTDKGVHALNQIIHFDTMSKIKVESLLPLLNNFLVDGIFIKEIEEVDATFHSRYDVKEKTYVYKINTKEYDPIQRNYEWYCHSVDFELLRKELNSVVGTHDFSTFTKKTDSSCVRTIYNVDLKLENDYAYITITGNGFLRFMVRNIVGTLINIATNREEKSILKLLQLRDVSNLKEKAPSSGLYLYKVTY